MSRHTDATLLLVTDFKFSREGHLTFLHGDEVGNDLFLYNSLLGNYSVLDPPDPIPNSEVKRNCADDSVGFPHVKVGHCQAVIPKSPGR